MDRIHQDVWPEYPKFPAEQLCHSEILRGLREYELPEKRNLIVTISLPMPCKMRGRGMGRNCIR